MGVVGGTPLSAINPHVPKLDFREVNGETGFLKRPGEYDKRKLLLCSKDTTKPVSSASRTRRGLTAATTNHEFLREFKNA